MAHRDCAEDAAAGHWRRLTNGGTRVSGDSAPGSSGRGQGKPRKASNWGWKLLGCLLLLALCDDDDERRHCYDFGGETRCFDRPLPENADCALSPSGEVACTAR